MNEIIVPEENLLPRVEGFAGLFDCVKRARNGISRGAMGAAEACWHAAREYAMDRRQFGKPHAAMQFVQKKLADMQADSLVGLPGSLRLGRLMEERRRSAELVSLMRRNNCGKALPIAREARDVRGANGVSDESGIIQHVMNLGAANAYEGPHDAHALNLGRGQAGLRAFQ